jgi:hypothetical protein
MYLLCDTCCVLMLIRLVPDMFTDPKFRCVTVAAIRNELVKTQKFKNKYPWRSRYIKHIKTLPISKLEDENFRLVMSTINLLHDSGKINEKTNKFFDLSPADKYLAACTIAHNYVLTTVDRDLLIFLDQEFDQQVQSPLSIINGWLEEQLISWDQNKQDLVEYWGRCHEPAQPENEKKRFSKLTGMKYLGP